MSERYIKVFSLLENLYAEGAPVIISAGNLLKDTQTGRMLAQLKIRNISEQPIKAAKVIIHALDTTGRPVEGDGEQEYLDLLVKAGEEFGQKVAIPLPNSSTRGFTVEVKEVAFTDNSVWAGTQAVWEHLPEGVPLARELGDGQLVNQFKIKHGPQSTVFPREHKGLWLCTCGTWNKDEKCYACGKEKGKLLPVDLPGLIQEKEERLQREKAEREAKEAAERTAARLRAERKARKTAERKRILRKIGITALIIAAVAFLAYATVWHIIPYVKYQNACKAVERQEFDTAYAAFVKLGSFSDSQEKAEDTLYQKAVSLMNSGAYTEAAKEFDRIPNYSDSKKQAQYCRNEAAYLEANSLLESGNYEEASKLFSDIIDYKDSKDHNNESRYLLANRLFEEGKYHEAYDTFQLVTSYKDSKDRAAEAGYLYGLERFEAKDYQEAMWVFYRIKNYKDSAERHTEAQYLYAIELTEQGDWKKASDLFGVLGDYEDSEKRYKETYYQYGLQMLSDKSYEEAVAVFEHLGSFEESKAKLNEAKYGYVLAHQDNNNTTTYSYLKDLKALGYKDSGDLYKTLYAWSVELVAFNTSKNDSTTILSSVSRKCSYLHFSFELSGGPPGEKITLSHKYYWPGGGSSYAQWYWEGLSRGYSFGAEWPDGFSNPSNMSTGTMTVKIYNKATGELLGEASIRLT